MTDWVAACMEPDEWETWVALNPRLTAGLTADRPCRDCPIAFSREMRAIGRCNGYPSGPAEEEDEPEMETTRARPKPVAVSVSVPCPRCTHREVCGIRPTIERLDTEGTEVALPELNAALTPTLTVSIECGFFERDKAVPKAASTRSDAGKPRGWSPEQRAAAAERMRARNAAKAAQVS